MDSFMLITLLAIGFAVFFAYQSVAARKSVAAEDKVMRGYFLMGLSGLMAKVAMADGRVTGDEAAMADKLFGRMNLSDSERASCVGNFVTARRDGLDARDHAKRFMAYANPAACRFLYGMLWRMSRVDGVVDPAEDALLKDIAVYLGLDASTYEHFKAGNDDCGSAADLRAAGVPKSLVAVAC